MIIRFSKEPDGTPLENNQSRLVMEFDAVELPDIVSHFEDFVRGCGFILDGHLDITED